jgi:DNA-directed RNA polymerase specialized sigma24 family protein
MAQTNPIEWRRVNVQSYSLDVVEESEGFVNLLDDPIGIEQFILQIKDTKIVEILVLKALGFKYSEIAEITGLSVNNYYILLRQLKKDIDAWNSL